MRRRTLYKAERIDGDLVTADDPRHSKHEEARREHSQREREAEAARRIETALAEARDGGYYTNGWYSYLRRSDVETLVAAVLR